MASVVERVPQLHSGITIVVCSGVVCICDPEHTAGTVHIPGLHLHPESLAGAAAIQADTGALSKPCYHVHMRNSQQTSADLQVQVQSAC
jgi:hypothetical protein